MLLLGRLVLALVPAAVTLVGQPRCPERTAIEAELGRISPGITFAANSTERWLALVELEPSGLRVKLYDATGHLLRDRLVEGVDTCPAWARIAAGLIATWTIHPGEPLIEERPSAASRGAAPSTSAQTSTNEHPSRDLRGEIGLGLGPTAALAGTGSLAPGGEIFIGLRRRSFPIGGELGFSTSSSRSIAIDGGGAVDWERFALSLGGYGVFGAGRLQLELGVAALGSLIDAGTRRPLPPRTARTFDGGLGLSTRLRWSFARNWNAWLRGGASLWLPSEVLAGSTAVTTIQLPSVDLFVTLGVSLVFDL